MKRSSAQAHLSGWNPGVCMTLKMRQRAFPVEAPSERRLIPSAIIERGGEADPPRSREFRISGRYRDISLGCVVRKTNWAEVHQFLTREFEFPVCFRIIIAGLPVEKTNYGKIGRSPPLARSPQIGLDYVGTLESVDGS